MMLFNKIDNIIKNAKNEIESVIIDTFFDDVKEIELKRYLKIGTTDYATIKKVAVKHKMVYVYYPNNRIECAWVKLTNLSIDQIMKVYKELETIKK